MVKEDDVVKLKENGFKQTMIDDTYRITTAKRDNFGGWWETFLWEKKEDKETVKYTFEHSFPSDVIELHQKVKDFIRNDMFGDLKALFDRNRDQESE